MEKSGSRLMLPQPTLRQLVVGDAAGGVGKSPWFGWVGCRKEFRADFTASTGDGKTTSLNFH